MSASNSFQPSVSSSKRQFNIFKSLFVLVLLVVPMSYYQGIQTGKNTASQPLIASPPTAVPAQTTKLSPAVTIAATTNQDNRWETAKYGGLFSYEYPSGWHVAELWGTKVGNNLTATAIVIDRDPINTRPRGGPLGTFTFFVISGNNNPDEILAEQINQFSQENYSDIARESLNTDIGAIFHYRGKIKGEMMAGQPVEKYYFTFNQNPKDLFNQQVVVASLEMANNPEYSSMLKHIVLSFKKLN